MLQAVFSGSNLLITSTKYQRAPYKTTCRYSQLNRKIFTPRMEDEEANGVAITSNIFDISGIDPALYINVQYGDGSVVLPDAMVTSDEILYYFDTRGKPIEYRGHLNVLPSGKTTVLTDAQIRTLGIALKEIHNYFKSTYGSNPEKRYAMDTEFKFDQPLDIPDGEPVLLMKQCRSYYAD